VPPAVVQAFIAAHAVPDVCVDPPTNCCQ